MATKQGKSGNFYNKKIFFKKFSKKVLTFDEKKVILSKSLTSDCGVRELSSAGRASALQAEGHRFEPCSSHHLILKFNMLV